MKEVGLYLSRNELGGLKQNSRSVTLPLWPPERLACRTALPLSLAGAVGQEWISLLFTLLLLSYR